MQVRLLDDPWGSWGGMGEERASYCLETVRETWQITRAEILEEGPFRAALWTHWQGTNSWLELTYYLTTNEPMIRVQGRLLMNDRSARLALILPCRGKVIMDVPGSQAERKAEGQLPAGRWVTRGTGKERLSFSSDVLGDVAATETELRVTLARASRYADDVQVALDETPWLPAVDCGELRFAFCLTNGAADLQNLAAALMQPPVALLVAPHRGRLSRTGSFGEILPKCVQLLSAQLTAPGKVNLRLQNCSAAEVEARWVEGTSAVKLFALRPRQIRSTTISLSRV